MSNVQDQATPNYSGNPVTVHSLLDSIAYSNKIVYQLWRDNNESKFLDSKNLLHINQLKDTVILFTNGRVTSIWSCADSVNIIRKYNTYHITKDTLFLEPYHRDLIVNWDIDSIVILCQYNRAVYYETPFQYVYRFIISDGNVAIESDYYGGRPEVPDFMADKEELEYRRAYRKAEKETNSKTYNRIFNRQRQKKFDLNMLKPKIILPKNVGIRNLNKK